MAVKHETELYKPIKSYFEAQGYEVKSEIMHCDLVAIHPAKRSNHPGGNEENVQSRAAPARDRAAASERSVILAVERNRKKAGAHNQRFGDLTELCRMLGIGFMTVTFFKTKAAGAGNALPARRSADARTTTRPASAAAHRIPRAKRRLQYGRQQQPQACNRLSGESVADRLGAQPAWELIPACCRRTHGGPAGRAFPSKRLLRLVSTGRTRRIPVEARGRRSREAERGYTGRLAAEARRGPADFRRRTHI